MTEAADLTAVAETEAPPAAVLGESLMSSLLSTVSPTSPPPLVLLGRRQPLCRSKRSEALAVNIHSLSVCSFVNIIVLCIGSGKVRSQWMLKRGSPCLWMS